MIPRRRVVKFKAGKEMKVGLDKLDLDKLDRLLIDLLSKCLTLCPDFGTSPQKPVPRRNHLFRVFKTVARAFHFSEYDAPILEPLDLYIEKSGENC